INIWALCTSRPRHQKIIAYTRRLLNFANWHSIFITMELINEFVNNQFALYVPVALVLVCVVLVFAFGFKSAEQPPFDKLSAIDSEERKTLGKKKKLKEKKTSANGNVVNVSEKIESPSKESKKKEQESIKKTDNKAKSDKKKSEPIRTVEEKIKKGTKSKVLEKPVDFDDGNWETVPTKGDKKKKQDSPAKKEKKPKKIEKSPEMDKLAKEYLNKELQENEKIVESLDSLTKESELKEIEVAVEPVEPKKEKKSEKKTKKTDVEKVENIEKEEENGEAVTPPKPEPESVEPVAAKLQEATKQPTANIAFDELGDVWTEAKQPKKSKKKSRREN
ncbi:hypothetical protein AMK59_8272, partial [Oryctes borbonicus]